MCDLEVIVMEGQVCVTSSVGYYEEGAYCMGELIWIRIIGGGGHNILKGRE